MAKIIFKMPKGDAEFDEMMPGEKMKVTCTVLKEKGGDACLVAVGGKTLEGYSDSDEEDEEMEDEAEDQAMEDDGGMMAALDEEMPNTY